VVLIETKTPGQVGLILLREPGAPSSIAVVAKAVARLGASWSTV
jgi:hypothetical protein